MPTEDDYGQGIDIAALTDGANAETLAAAIVNALTQRSIMRFTSASNRNATLTEPVEGMMAWLQTENLLTLYDGAAWVAVSTGVSEWTTIGLASGFTHNGNSNGTLQYRLLNISGEESLQFRGAINRTSYPTNPPSSYIINSTALPTTVRPSTLRTIVVPCSDVTSERITLKLDIQPNGFLQVFGFGSSVKPPWIGFNGCLASL